MLRKGRKLIDTINVEPIKKVDISVTYHSENPLVDSFEKLEFFDFLKIFFTDDQNMWFKVDDKTKKLHGYRLMQFLSIEYPTTIFNISQLTNNVGVIDSLHNIFKVMDYPSWLYVDGKSKTKNSYTTLNNLKKYPKNLIDNVKERYKMDGKDFELFVELFGQEFFSYLESEKNVIEMKAINKIKK